MKLKKTEKAETPGFDANQFAAEAEQRPAAKKAKKRQPTSFLMPEYYSKMLDDMSEECNSRVVVMKAGLIALSEMTPEERFKLYMQASKKTD
ncbi:TPA: hypothetical protein MG739_25140 [Klebsiella pneumoniae]|uniref:Uncharacterized protein n=1 Tax=Klebsiella pneumoniae TaxID=573 RepID=A0A3G4RJ77_KLEPN|nr:MULTISPECIES: hypothetical protein [Klebsiella]AYU65714.1 hypothetical protein [Klebsiella pneumoniae]MBC4425509.1 hypothetical protein [Klebsiella variicola]MBK2797285.1 hypothetical protein [Klebsiella pneumoniae]MBY5246608.1 hypothetical protein [Klebsiella quasipneumoniae]MCC4959753.1 hypothetical protein [Klebsiella pneumoniae]